MNNSTWIRIDHISKRVTIPENSIDPFISAWKYYFCLCFVLSLPKQVRNAAPGVSKRELFLHFVPSSKTVIFPFTRVEYKKQISSLFGCPAWENHQTWLQTFHPSCQEAIPSEISISISLAFHVEIPIPKCDTEYPLSTGPTLLQIHLRYSRLYLPPDPPSISRYTFQFHETVFQWHLCLFQV